MATEIIIKEEGQDGCWSVNVSGQCQWSLVFFCYFHMFVSTHSVCLLM